MVILLLFALLFWWVMHRKPAPAAAGGGRRGAIGGTVTLNIATAKTGNIGVYLDAIGTVTPVYTTTLISQVTGVLTQVNYREGQLVRRGQTLIQIDPRQYQANVLAAQGALERDTNLLAQARWTWSDIRTAWARNAIARNRPWTRPGRSSYFRTREQSRRTREPCSIDERSRLAYVNITCPHLTGSVGLRAESIPATLYKASSSTTPWRSITQIAAHHRGFSPF